MPEAVLDRAHLDTLLHADPAAARAEVRAAARAGDVTAQLLYAQMLCEGRAGPRDEAEGLHWYSLAASAGHALAMNMLGRCHELGCGTGVDEALAAVWYRKAADAGLDWGMYNLANLLATGRGVRQDRARAFTLYCRAATLGHAKSMNLVGRHYEEGWEVEPDPRLALTWYRRSAEAGDFRGQASYAAILTQAECIDEAAHWLRQAATTGTPAFLSSLGEQLAASPHATLRAIGADMRARATALAALPALAPACVAAES